MSKIKGVLVDVQNNTVEVAELEHDLDSFHEVINCRCIDIVDRRIGGKYFSIICDDEGMLTDNPRISAIGDSGYPMLVGNLFVVGSEDGDICSLTDQEAAYVLSKVENLATVKHPEPYKMLTQLDY